MTAQQPDALTQQLHIAYGLINRNRLEEAANLLHQILAHDPTNVMALGTLAEIAIRSGHPRIARQFMAKGDFTKPTPEHGVLLARIANDLGEFDEAVKFYLSVLKDSPQHIDALIGLGRIYYDAGYRDLAIECCEKAQALIPDNFMFLRGIAKLYSFSDGERLLRLFELARPAETAVFETKLEYYAQLIQTKEYAGRAKRGLPPIAQSLDDMAFQFAQDELAALEALTDKTLAENPAQPNAALYKAICLTTRGMWKEAAPLFQIFTSQRPGSLFDITTADEAFYRQLQATDDTALFGDLPPVTDVQKADFTDAPIIFLSCDPKYFVQFARPLLLSINEVARDSQVHIHIMNATPDDADAAKAFCARLTHVKTAISVEDVGARITDKDSARNYYHAIRFIRMYQYLKTYQKPLWLLDVDALMNRDPRQAFESVAPADVAVRGHPARLEPWAHYNASVVGIQPTARGTTFLRLVAAYISHFYHGKKMGWGIDQLAMYGVLTFLRSTGQAPSMAMLGATMIENEYTPHSAIWGSGSTAKFFKTMRLAHIPYDPPESPQMRYLAALDKYTALLDK